MTTETNPLYNMIYDNRCNRENLGFLLTQFDKRDFVAFMGAGLASSMKKIPSWPELYKLIKKKYSIRVRKIREYPDALSFLYKKCPKKKEFYNHIFEFVTPDASPPAIYETIYSVFDCYATTNFYDPMETLDSIRGWGLKKFYFVFPELCDDQKNSITYLHGHREVGFCIARREDYDYFYPSLAVKNIGIPVLENSLRYLFISKRVIFLGISLEKHIKSFLGHLVNEVGNNTVKEHFWILSQDAIECPKDMKKTEKDEFDRKFFGGLSAINIRPIVYKGDHTFVDRLLEIFRSSKNNIVQDAQPTPSELG